MTPIRLLILVILISGYSWAQTEEVFYTKSMNVRGKAFEVKIFVSPSKPNSKGGGQCGSGTEMTMKVYDSEKKVVHRSLVSSCLKDMVLKTEDSKLENSFLFTGKGVFISWLMFDGKKDQTAFLDLSKAKPDFKMNP